MDALAAIAAAPAKSAIGKKQNDITTEETDIYVLVSLCLFFFGQRIEKGQRLLRVVQDY